MKKIDNKKNTKLVTSDELNEINLDLHFIKGVMETFIELSQSVGSNIPGRIISPLSYEARNKANRIIEFIDKVPVIFDEAKPAA